MGPLFNDRRRNGNRNFYYIDDQYFKDFPDPYLMQNKEKVNGQLHDRPVFTHSRIVIPAILDDSVFVTGF